MTETRMATKAELETLIMPIELPVYEEDLAALEAKKPKKKQYQNILSVQINRLMNHFKVDATPIAKATGIPESTLHGWVNFIIKTQDLDSNVKAVANYFGVSIDYFAFGTPVSDRDVELEDLMPDIDMPANAEAV